MAHLLEDLRLGIVHLFYPRLCEGCTKPLLTQETVLCTSCAVYLPETGYASLEENETALRFAGRIPFVYATSYGYFTNDGLLQHLLHGLKYKDKKETGYYLGRLLGGTLREGFNRLALPVSFDFIIPVPLHKSKELKRGYNQSSLIAEGISQALDVPVREDILLRIRHTESQTNKSRAERIANMQDAFQVKDETSYTGKHILLCDDVLTTGATLEACALALRKDKTVKISFATVGIAVS